MLEVLTRKDGSAQVKTVNSTMQSFVTQEPYDMALCVFTVIIYVLDQLPLENALEAAANAVKPDGLILIDVPSRAIFNGVQIENKGFKRVSRVEVIDSYRYRYSDNIQVEIGGETRKYSDEFMIRYWPPDKIKTLFHKFGMIMISELERDFFGSGSNYFLFRKRN
jgi:SAM-dependent methyltransferase